MNIIFGHIGSDAGYWYLGSDGKLHHVPGWNPEARLELTRTLAVLQQATQLKTPGLADAVAKSLNDHIQREVGGLLKEGGVLFIHGGH